MRKIIIKGLLYLFLLLVILASASAFSISPSSKISEYDLDKVIGSSIRILNDEKIDLDIGVNVSGELSEFIRIEKDNFAISHNHEEKIFKYKMKINRTLSPGLHKGKITFTRYLKNKGLFDYKVSLNYIFAVKVPMDGKHASYQIFKEDIDGNLQFSINVVNNGTEDLDDYSFSINVYDTRKNLVFSDSKNGLTLDSNKNSVLYFKWNNYPLGEYSAETSMKFDGRDIKKSQNLLLKRSNLDPSNRIFNLNEIGIYGYFTLFLIVLALILLIFQIYQLRQLNKKKIIYKTFHKRKSKK